MAIPLKQIEGKYEILAKISEGGMGAVYKVRHRLLDEVRVIKVMRPQLSEEQDFRERFQREARLATRLRHPAIAQLYDFAIDEEGTAFMVIEYIPGLTLQQLLTRHGIPSVGLAVAVARQAAEALHYLHRKGIVHRDVSPDNLMVARDDDGGPLTKLIDLGIAKPAEGGGGLTQTGMFVGKVKYSSPEHFRAQEGTRLDGRSDLYSLAVVLYELLTGRHPIGVGSVSQIIAGHLFQEPTPFDQADADGRVPDDLRALILRNLAKAPADRSADAQAFARDLEAIEERLGVSHDEVATVVALAGHGATPVRQGTTQGRIDGTFVAQPTPPPTAAVTGDADLFTGPAGGATQESTAVPGAPEVADGGTYQISVQRPAPEVTERAAEARPVAVPTVAEPAAPGPIERPAPERPAAPAVEPVAPAVRPRRRTALVAAAVVVVAVAVALVVVLARGGGPPTPATLILDAAPYGEVTAILDDDGRAVELPAETDTPVVLQLAPGAYRVSVRDPRTGEEIERTVNLQAGETTREVVPLAPVDAQELVDELMR